MDRPTPPLRVAMVVSRFNDEVTARLESGALRALSARGIPRDAVAIFRVPGAFEIPMAARHAAATGRFDAIVALGCVIRGETAHFEYISSAASHGLMAAAAATGVPMAFGILTTESDEQALARAGDEPSANKGWEAADAAVDMALLYRDISGSGRGTAE